MDITYWLTRVFNTEGPNRVELARKNLNRAMEDLQALDIPKDVNGLFALAVIKMFVRADRAVTFEDYSFVSEVLNRYIGFEEFQRKMRDDNADEDRINWLDDVIDRFSTEGKEALCIFGMCIMQSNDSLSKEEHDLFDRILR